MSMLIAALIFIPLLAAAIALIIWSLGGSWPLRDRALLSRAVRGREGAALPARPLLFLLALLTLGEGITALALADYTAGGWPLTLAGALLAALFVARGAWGRTAPWRAAHGAEPFATLDRRTYTPAALAIGTGFLLLVLIRLF